MLPTRCDFSLALAPFRRRWGTTSLLVGLIALGIALATVNASIFLFLHARPLPWSQGDRLVIIGQVEKNQSVGTELNNLTLENYLAIRDVMGTVESMVGLRRWGSATWRDARGSEVVSGGLATPGYFDTLGVRMALGRAPSVRADEQRNPAGVVITHGLWERRFGADPGAIGQVVTLNDAPHEVVGVFARGQVLPGYTPGEMPEYFAVLAPDRIPTPEWRSRWYQSVALRREGVALDEIQAELDVQTARLRQLFPQLMADRWLVVRDFRAWVMGEYGRYFRLLVLMASLLSIAIAVNAANLVVSRLRGQRRYAGTALSLGGSPAQVRAPLFLEQLLVALAGVGLAVPVTVGYSALVRWRLAQARLDIPMFDGVAFGAASLVVASSLLFLVGWCTRSWFRARATGPGGSSSRTIVASGRLQSADGLAVGLQTVLAVSLVTTAVLIASSLAKRDRANTHLALPELHEVYVSLRPDRYPTPEALFQGWQSMKAAIRSLPGARGVALTRTGYPAGEDWIYSFSDDLDTVDSRDSGKRAMRTTGDEDYFALTGIRIVNGRGFSVADIQPGRRVVVVSRILAESYWPDGEPVGRRIKLAHRTEDWSEVIGVAENIIDDARDTPLPLLWRSWAGQVENHSGVLIAFEPGTAASQLALQEKVWSADPDAQFYGYGIVRQNRARWNWLPRTIAQLAGLLAAAAAVIGGLGLFSVMGRRFVSSQREIAVRKALGAPAWRTVVAFAWRDALAVMLGAGCGVILGMLGAEALFSAANLSAAEKAVAPAIALAVTGAGAVIGALVPLARALALDPVPLLRTD